MNRKKFLTAGAMVVLVVGLMAGAMGTALASPGNGAIFELDASLDLSNGSSPKAAITDNATTNKPDDWDRVCHTATASATTPQCTTAANDHATARSFDSETTATGSANNATIFTGGGSKDQQPTGSWAWKDASGGLPDKDNLLHAMTARYDGTNSYIFFAADRFDNSGDAQIGFWFFNNTVGPLAGGSFGPGSHKAGVVPHDPAHSGDILILSDFTNGGTQPTIRIFEYVGSGGSDGSLNLLGGSTDDIRDCGSVPTDDFCGSVNNLDGAAVPWLFLNKSGQSSFGHGEFYEGGLNLNFLGLQNECFASFLAETRSSQSVTATLKDFVGGSFQNCSATAVTTPSSTSVSPGTPVTDTILITGAGPALPPFPSSPPNVFFSYCGPIAAPATCGATTTAISNNALSNTATQGVSTATSSAINTAANPLAPGRYCFKATWAGDANYPLGASDSGVNECFTVSQIPTTTVTTPSNGSGVPLTGTQPLGTSLFDKAVVTANTAGGGDVTGNVNFFICNPSQISGSAGAEVCAAGAGTALTGNPRLLVATAGANPPSSSVLSSPGVPANAAGLWCFRATYVPTGSTYTGSSDGSHSECVLVGPENTTTVTTPQIGGAAITPPTAVGASVTDHAVVTATTNSDGTPTGTINFFICNPTQVIANGGTCSTGGTPAGSKTAAAVANSNPPASFADSDAITANAVGTWCFRAVYVPGGTNGANYNGSSDASTGECFTVTDTTSASSVQNWLPNDSATITATGGTALSGSLTIQLYTGGTCGVGSGSAVSGQLYTFTLSNEASGTAHVTSNTTFKVTATGTSTVSWLETFTSSNPNVGNSSHCESTTLTITN